ncbi:MAG: PLP-dependent lyase/thiolase [Candidatus Aenigmarchaeota archaeon]|nr:PLP-dependent lyase/thiolase [Candidatus Aenigmarchaeota archaeon]
MGLSAQEERILNSIKIGSENDPKKPEFPPDNPKFPATPTYKIKVPGFSDVWLKDESVNPTGTHKDRMAWEIVVTYRDLLLAKKSGQIKGGLPPMSIISSGSAALAIQTQMRKFGLPDLKVLTDVNTDHVIIGALKGIGCEIYLTDLSRKPFNQKEILDMTHNPNGFDITSSEALDPTTRFYDWMSYEIINNSPDYVFVPFGTGNLYENILNINKREVSAKIHDPRFGGDVEKLKACNFIGATTNNPKSKAIMLYSPHLPFVHYDEQWIRSYKYQGFCGNESNVHLVREEFLDEAFGIAESQDVTCSHSGIAGLALILQTKDRLPKNKKMLIVNTGKAKWSGAK